jgi:hypothetical protein
VVRPEAIYPWRSPVLRQSIIGLLIGRRQSRPWNMWWPNISMRRPVPAGLYGSKFITPLPISLQHREAFEIGVDRYRRRVARMSIFAQRICLPDLDTRAGHRPFGQGQHLSLNLQELSVGTSCSARRLREVCRLICSSVQGIEGPEDLIGGSQQWCRGTSYIHRGLETLEEVRRLIAGA